MIWCGFPLGNGVTVIVCWANAEMALPASKSEARRLIDQKGVHLGDDSLEDPKAVLRVHDAQILRVGKRRFVRLLPPK